MKLLLTLQDTAEQLDVSVRTVRRNSPYYWASYIDELLVRYLKATQNVKRAAERDRSSAKHLYPFFTGMLLNDITGPVVSDYIAQRRNVAAAGTINKEVGLLSSAINWAKRELGWEIQNPVDGRRPREPEGRIRWITKAEAASLLEAAAYERRALPFVRLGLVGVA